MATAASRLGYSLRNIGAAWLGLGCYMVANFVTRAIFARTLGQDFLGTQGLFTSVLMILSLAELGVGSAITFALYEPLGKKDHVKVCALMQLFKYAYTAIGVFVLIVGACLTPFIHLVISEIPDYISYSELQLYFFLFVLNTGVSYFFSYKGIFITANQREYVVSLVQYLFLALMSAIQGVLLLLTHSYLVFLITMVVCTFLQNACIAYVANKNYPFLKEKPEGKITEIIGKETLSKIKKNLVALVFHRIGGIATAPLITLFLTNFAGLAVVGLYANYQLIESAIERIFDKLFSAVIASVGNLVVLEGSEQTYRVFNTSFFVNALCYGVATGGFIASVNSFIPLWVGPEYRFAPLTVILIGLGIYVYGMRSSEQSFTSAYGLYWQSRYKPLAEFVVFIACGYLCMKQFGINGLLLVAVLIKIVISTTIEVYVLFKHGFQKSPLLFYKNYLAYTVVIGLSLALTMGIVMFCDAQGLSGLLAFFIYAFLGAALPTLALFICFWKTQACQHTRLIMRQVAGKVVGRLKRA